MYYPMATTARLRSLRALVSRSLTSNRSIRTSAIVQDTTSAASSRNSRSTEMKAAEETQDVTALDELLKAVSKQLHRHISPN